MSEFDVTIVIPPTGNTIVVDPNAAAAAAASAALAASDAAVATTQAANASTSAAAALTSQNATATSATNAANSATAASTSETNAAASAATSTTNSNSVTALLASFRGAFLGAFASDSDAATFAAAHSITLSAGVMYENTTEDKFRIYSGSAWGDYDASAQASQSAAALSATNAAASASAASTSETNAANSATNASNSASAASTSATNASNSATNASSSAAAAAGSAASAAGLRFNSVFPYNTNQTLGSAQRSAAIQWYGGSAGMITLEQSTDGGGVPGGTAVLLYNDSTANLTIACQGSDEVYDSFALHASIVLVPGENVILAYRSASTQIDIVGGTYANRMVSRVLLGNATDDGSTTLQVNGTGKVSGALTASKVLVGQADNGTDVIQGNGSVSATGAGGVLRAIGAAAAAAAQLVSTALGLDLLASGNNPLRVFTNALERLRVTGAGRVLINTTTDDGANELQVNGGVALHTAAANAQITLDSNAARYREIAYETAGSLRWTQGANNVAESGSNAGSDWFLSRYTDAGGLVDSPVSIVRSTGVATFSERPVFGANLAWDAGNFNPANYLPLSGASAMTGALTLAAAGITFSDGSNQGTAAPGKNRIINGACRVVQRGSLITSAGVSGYGGPDRFYAANVNSAGGQFTQSAGTITYNGVALPAVVQTVNSAITNSSGSNFWYGITQKIEGYNCFDMLGSRATLSFIFSTNVSGTYSVAICDGPSTSQSYVTTFSAVAGTPVRVVIPVASLPTNLATQDSSTRGLQVSVGTYNTGTYQTSTLNSWQSGTLLCASGLTNWAAAANNFIALTNMKLEVGGEATPMEPRLFSDDIAACYRYYEIAQSNIVAYSAASGANLSCNVPFETSKRVTPTIALTRVFTGGAAPASSSVAGVTLGGTVIYIVSNGTGNAQATDAVTADAEL